MPEILTVEGQTDILEGAIPSIAYFSRGTSFRQLPYNGYFQGSVVVIPLSTQNPVLATGCGFDPRHRHQKMQLNVSFGCIFA
jgi:hypothetical protein